MIRSSISGTFWGEESEGKGRDAMASQKQQADWGE
jgi:hypothetical protein